MDLISHLLWASLVNEFSLPLVLGTIFPDMVYLIAYPELRKSKKKNGLWRWGERLHSIFFSGALLFVGFLVGLPWLFSFGFGWSFHIFLDLLTHKHGGARYLYPYTDKTYKIGICHWSEKWALITNYLTLSVLYLVKYLR